MTARKARTVTGADASACSIACAQLHGIGSQVANLITIATDVYRSGLPLAVKLTLRPAPLPLTGRSFHPCGKVVRGPLQTTRCMAVLSMIAWVARRAGKPSPKDSSLYGTPQQLSNGRRDRTINSSSFAFTSPHSVRRSAPPQACPAPRGPTRHDVLPLRRLLWERYSRIIVSSLFPACQLLVTWRLKHELTSETDNFGAQQPWTWLAQRRYMIDTLVSTDLHLLLLV